MAQMIAPGTRWVFAWALASTIALLAVGACSSPLSVGSQVGRYAIVWDNRQLIHRLDTATGEIRLFVVRRASDEATSAERGNPFGYFESGILRPGGKE
jgi:hypothetical protein